MTEPLPPQKVGDPRGWLTFEPPLLPPDLQRREDATQAHDYARSQSNTARWVSEYDPTRGHKGLCFYRAATDTERFLLEQLGHGPLPDQLDTRVEFLTETLRQRRWPALEESSTP